MSTTADFYDLLMPELPGCTSAMVDLHLRAVAREFCLKTSVWRQSLTPVDLVAAQAAYTLPMPSSAAELVRVTALTVAGNLLWLNRDRRDTDDQDAKYRRHQPPFDLSADLVTLTLIEDETPSAALAGGLQVDAALKPTFNAATLPDFLKTQYSEAMKTGTLSRLMLMNKKPWTDRGLAATYAIEYGQHLNFAAYQGRVGNTRGQLRVKKWG